ncbi:MAG TPA: hypothetical protein VK174_06065 [Chitinophagales bacterium]|nr:hypothetical protein [Chitinophagales bacterium]
MEERSGLIDITVQFQKGFNNGLVDVSAREDLNIDCLVELRTCKKALWSINQCYRASFMDVLVITKPKDLDSEELIFNPDSLPKEKSKYRPMF